MEMAAWMDLSIINKRGFMNLGVDSFPKRIAEEYARARRMGLAMKQIRAGEAVIDAQLSTGYKSSSGFIDKNRNSIFSANVQTTCL